MTSFEIIFFCSSWIIWAVGSIYSIIKCWGDEDKKEDFVTAWMALFATTGAPLLLGMLLFVGFFVFAFGIIPEWLHKLSINGKTTNENI